jgi:hypothetical protein
MSLSIGKWINFKLSGITSSINALMVPINAEQLQNYIVYKRRSVAPDDNTNSRDGVAYDRCEVEIDIVSVDYVESIDLAEEVRDKLENVEGSVSNVVVNQCILLSADENTDGNLFIQSLVFEFLTN